MSIELKKNCKYALLVPTSMGVRITPVNGQPVHSSSLFEMQATSAETNVASISSFLGLPVKVLTTFVKESPIAQFIKSNLRSRNMDFEGPEIPQGDHGVTGTSSTSPTAVTEHAARVYKTTAPVKWGVPLM